MAASAKAPMVPAASWSHLSGNTEMKREHDFNNWLHELVLAVECADSRMVTFISDELRQSYQQANRKRRRVAK